METAKMGGNAANGVQVTYFVAECLIYKVDRFNCLMKSAQMDAFFNHLFTMPFENCEKMQSWIKKS